jgi:membrane-bound lytic murein transglycosylase D
MDRQSVRTALAALLLATRVAGAEPPADKPKQPERKTAPAPKPPAAKPAGAGSLPEVRPNSLPEVSPGVDPERGRGRRSVAEGDAPRAAEPAKPAAPKPAAAPPAGTTKDTSAAKASATKPAAAPSARPSGSNGDPQLASMREAELALFPRPLPGVMPGWSWDLPKPVGSSAPEVVTGAPAATRFAPASRAEPARDAAWLRSLSLPNLPVRFEQRVLDYLTFYRENQSGRGIARAWAKKIGRFGPLLRSELSKAGVPSDLVCLSLIESGHNLTIVSPAGAAGIWQFMPDAGRAYGLVIDRWVDERLDPQRATEAAARYLSELYRRFGSWDLAMAAYNMGYGGLGRAIRKFNTNDYWELARYEAGLPWETTLYVPKILATAVLLGNRRAFGLDDVPPDPTETTDTVLVAPGISLDAVAKLASVSSEAIENLNPQYLAGRTPPPASGAPGQSWRVRVPAGKGAAVQAGLARVALKDESYRPYVVKRGETLESIALARGTTEAQLRLINRVAPKELLVAGAVLLVPEPEPKRDDDASRSVAVVPPRAFDDEKRRRVFYRVASGDSVEKLAELFGVTRTELLQWNSIDDRARLQPDMTLQLFVPRSRDLSRVPYQTEATTRVLVAGTPEFFDYFEGQNGKRRVVIRCRKGDSLADIGKRYGMTIGWMERVNRRGRSEDLEAGMPIVVYTDRAGLAPGDVEFEEPRARLATPLPSAPLASGAASSAARASAD